MADGRLRRAQRIGHGSGGRPPVRRYGQNAYGVRRPGPGGETKSGKSARTASAIAEFVRRYRGGKEVATRDRTLSRTMEGRAPRPSSRAEKSGSPPARLDRQP